MEGDKRDALLRQRIALESEPILVVGVPGVGSLGEGEAQVWVS